MKSLSVFLLFLVLPLLSPAADASTTYIGNAGDGYYVPGRGLILTDFLAELNKAPWIGNEIDPVIEKQFRSKETILRFLMDPVTENLFLRKLSDAQKKYPHLGEYLLAAAQMQVWMPWGDSIELLPLSPNEYWVPKGNWVRRQLAVRSRYFTYVDPVAWDHLSAENRVGLLIHESVSALTEPKCISYSGFLLTCKAYEQSFRSVRQNVADLFDADFGGGIDAFRSLAIPPWLDSKSEPLHYEIKVLVYCAPGFEQLAYQISRADSLWMPVTYPSCPSPKP